MPHFPTNKTFLQESAKSWVYFSLALGYFMLCGSTPVTYSSAHFLVLKGSRAITNPLARLSTIGLYRPIFLLLLVFLICLPSGDCLSFKATSILPLLSDCLLLSPHHCEASVSFCLKYSMNPFTSSFKYSFFFLFFLCFAWGHHFKGQPVGFKLFTLWKILAVSLRTPSSPYP